MNVILLWAIPGSGKTNFADSLKDYRSIDIDHMSKKYKGDKLIKQVADEVSGYLYYKHNVVLDGLITTNEIARKLFIAIYDSPYGKENPISYEIVVWDRNVEACKHNDRGRRKQNSTMTIEHHPFEEPSEELIREFNVKVTRKTVVRKPEYKAWMEEHGVYVNKDGKMRGQRWSLGGTWGNCWGEKGTVSGNAQPGSFTEFDELLESVCPEITFLQYKKLYNETVSTEEYSECDYYGGCVNYARFVCNLEKLYEMLDEMGHVPGNN